MSEWISYDGLGNPLTRTTVEVRMRNGSTETGSPDEFDWTTSYDEPETDIVAYRVVASA